MVFVCFHSNDFVSLSISNVENFRFNIICNRVAIFCNKNDMYFQTILTSVRTIVSVILSIIHLKILIFINYCYILCLVKYQ